MQTKDAIHALAALAQETRLNIFRHLVRLGPDGANAGAVAAALGVNASTLSFHLAQLEGAGLLRSTRVHRQIFYAADIDGMGELLTFLTADCCDGRPEICTPLAESLTACQRCA